MIESAPSLGVGRSAGRLALDDEAYPVQGLRALLSGPHAAISWALLVCGTGWGLVNFGFLLWLPTNLRELGVDAAAASGLLAKSALLSLPGIALVIWLYHRWSIFKTLVLFSLLTAASLLGFALIALLGLRELWATTVATVALLVSVSGVIAASSKAGGILGAGLALFGFFEHFLLSALLIALPMALSAWMLARRGVETRGVGLEAIQREIRAR